MITGQDAALRAGLILEYPADNPGQGWELTEFPQGWLVNCRGWKDDPGQFCIVIERETGLVRYFTDYTQPWEITTEYETVRQRGYPDDRWTQQQAPGRPARPRTSRAAPRQPPRTRAARRPGAVLRKPSPPPR